MKDYAYVLRYTNEALVHIARAGRQEKRLQRAYRRLERTPIGVEGSRWASASYGRASARVNDETYFLMVTLRNVLRSRELMEHFGHPMPEFRQARLIQAWRNIDEHWGDPPRGKEIWATKAWGEESDEVEPGLSTTALGDRLHTISGLNLRRLRKDLRRLKRAIGEVSNREWYHCYVTADEAAEILGMNLDQFHALPVQPMSLDFGGRDGVRYWREWVEAQAEGHVVPPRWLENGWVRVG